MFLDTFVWQIYDQLFDLDMKIHFEARRVIGVMPVSSLTARARVPVAIDRKNRSTLL